MKETFKGDRVDVIAEIIDFIRMKTNSYDDIDIIVEIIDKQTDY